MLGIPLKTGQLEGALGQMRGRWAAIEELSAVLMVFKESTQARAAQWQDGG